jgi:23S rRNA (uracil1939-C5)-methyltransferase
MAEEIFSVSCVDADGSSCGSAGGSADAKKNARLRLALPGERLRALAAGDFFLPKEIIAAHPGRVVPPCRFFGRCGGCDLQQANYPLQLALKRQLLAHLMAVSPSAAVRAAVERIPAVLPSPRQFGYRQRLRLVKARRGALGFRGFHSHEAVAIDRCLLARPEIGEAFSALIGSKDFLALLAVIEDVEFLLNPDRREVDLLIRLVRPSRPANRHSARRLLADIQPIGRIFFYGEKFLREPPICRDGRHENNPPGDEALSLTYPASPALPQGAALRWPVGGFSQVNIEQNRAMLEFVLCQSAASGNDSVLELFCGAGNFSVPLARLVKSFLGVEGQGAAIRLARENARLAGLDDCRFEQADVHDFCRKLAGDGEQFSFILLDPPRSGIPGLARTLSELCSRRLILISCEPRALVRDLAALCQEGFLLRCLQPFDMFPQTRHLETVAVLEK